MAFGRQCGVCTDSTSCASYLCNSSFGISDYSLHLSPFLCSLAPGSLSLAHFLLAQQDQTIHRHIPRSLQEADATDSKLIPIAITSVTIILASLAWMHTGIYENHFNNILEAFFIANLCMFAAATFYSQTNKPGWDGTAYLFVGLAFAAFICIVLFHVYLILRETAVWKRSKPNVTKYFRPIKEEKKDHLPNTCDEREHSFILRAPPTQSSVQLREPLLEQ